jgi:hypothetical protein
MYSFGRNMIAGLHYEDIKASIRKKWRSLNAFEAAYGLAKGSVMDWGRGRTSARVQTAIEHHLASIISPVGASMIPDSSKRARRAHRLNEKAA